MTEYLKHLKNEETTTERKNPLKEILHTQRRAAGGLPVSALGQRSTHVSG